MTETPKPKGRPPGSKNKKKKKTKKKSIILPPMDDDQISDSYQRKKEMVARRDKLKSMLGRDIGAIPPVKNQQLRDDCEFNFKLFCESYFPLVFHKEWSDDHDEAIIKIQNAVKHGGLFALAMPRGSGKTSLVEIGVIWALVYGHRKFIALIGSDEPAATQMLDSIKSEYEHNEKLLQDFPEICVPIAALDGTMQRAHSQLCEGTRTEVKWKGKEIVLPTIKGSRASGSVIRCAGITGRIRGMKFKKPDGSQIRPDLVILDDPQTDESAKSEKQNIDRLEIVTGAVLGLAGPGEKIAGFMPCTVIKEGDMADTVLNPMLYPEWQGQRTRMVVEFPTNESIWLEYEKQYQLSYKLHGDLRLATQFYKEHKKLLREGAKVSWEARFNDDEVDALQHAMNLMYRDEYAFWAEYQNAPKRRTVSDVEMLKPAEIILKTNGHPRFEVPFGCQLVTVGVDIQKYCLYYTVFGWMPNGTCFLMDYGAFPDQLRDHFVYRDVKKTYLNKAGGGMSADIFKALQDWVPTMMDREWQSADGTILRVDQMLIDCNWEPSKESVFSYCRASPYGNTVLPSIGRSFGAIKAPMSDLPEKQGEKRGNHWNLTYPKTTQSVRFILFDTNYWKSWVHERIATGMGGDGCMSFFGREPRVIRMFADQVTAEYAVKVEAKGREVEEWQANVGRPDNHLFDATVLSSVGADMRGLDMGSGQKLIRAKSKPSRSMADEIAERRKHRDR